MASASVSSILSSLQSIVQGASSSAYSSLNTGMNRVADLLGDTDITPINAPLTTITLSPEDFRLSDIPSDHDTRDPKELDLEAPDVNIDLQAVEFRDLNAPSLVGYKSPAEFVASAGDFTREPPTLSDIDGLLSSIEKPILELASLPDLISIEIPDAPGISVGVLPSIVEFVEPERPLLSSVSAPQVYSPSLSAAPDVSVPAFTTGNIPSDMDDVMTADQSIVIAEELTDKALNETLKAYINQNIDEWERKWAPEFSKLRADWSQKLGAQLDPNAEFTIVSDKFEADLYTRAKNRVGRETQAVIGQVSDAMRKRGFTLPPAALNAGIVKAQQQMADSLAAQATEIAVERQRLEYEHSRFLLDLGNSALASIRSMAQQNVALSIQSFQVAFNYAQSFLDTAIKASQLMIEQYKAKAQLYLVDAQVYEYRLKASLAALDIYKINLESERVKAELSKLEVDTYVATLEGDKVKVAIYEAQLEGEKSKADISRLGIEAYRAGLEAQKTKADIYQAQVDGEKAKAAVNQSVIEAYKARIQAEEVKIQSYVAQLQGINAVAQVEKAKVDMFESSVKAYAAEVAADETKAKIFQTLVQGESVKMQVNSNLLDAYSKRIQAETARMQGTVEANKGRVTIQQNIIEAYKAEIAAFVAENQAIASFNDVQARKYIADIERYRGESTAKAAMVQAKAEGMRAELSESVANAQIQLSAQKAELEAKVQLMGVYMEGEKAMAAFNEGLAQSALSGINGMASEITQN